MTRWSGYKEKFKKRKCSLMYCNMHAAALWSTTISSDFITYFLSLPTHHTQGAYMAKLKIIKTLIFAWHTMHVFTYTNKTIVR